MSKPPLSEDLTQFKGIIETILDVNATIANTLSSRSPSDAWKVFSDNGFELFYHILDKYILSQSSTNINNLKSALEKCVTRNDQLEFIAEICSGKGVDSKYDHVREMVVRQVANLIDDTDKAPNEVPTLKEIAALAAAKPAAQRE